MALLNHIITSWQLFTKYTQSQWYKLNPLLPSGESQRSSISESRDLLLEESQEKDYQSLEKLERTRFAILTYGIIGLVAIAAAVVSVSIVVAYSTGASYGLQKPQADADLSNLKDPIQHGGKQPILYLDPAHNYSLKSPCGRSPREAREAGCHFELFSFSWVPDGCYNPDLVETFNAIQEWNFWLNKDGTGHISQHEAQTGNYDALYTTWSYHLQHCTAMWQKMHRALLGNGYSGIDSIVANLGHTEHCSARLLMQDIPMDRIVSKAIRGFPDCGLLRV